MVAQEVNSHLVGWVVTITVAFFQPIAFMCFIFTAMLALLSCITIRRPEAEIVHAFTFCFIVLSLYQIYKLLVAILLFFWPLVLQLVTSVMPLAIVGFFCVFVLLSFTGSTEFMMEGPKEQERTDTGHVHQDGAAHICSDFIHGQCKNGARCAKHHCAMPYQWQCNDPDVDNTWITCDEKDNETLERYYCDPSNGDDVKIKLNKTHFHLKEVEMVLDFGNMTMSSWPSYNKTLNMRRLSTESHETNPGNSLATRWIWYWQNDNAQWERYQNQPWYTTEVQREIERAFLDPSERYYNYSTSEHSYKLYLGYEAKELYQKNQRLGTERKIRRRPEIRPRDRIEQLKKSKKKNTQHQTSSLPKAFHSDGQQPGLPSHWSQMSQGKDFERIELRSDSEEFMKVKKQFSKTMKEKQQAIVKIERVQNPYMWEKFARKKQKMKTKSRGSSLEKDLFHGTDPDTVEKICKENFDWRLYGRNATVYGQGSYFAVKASYSDSYAQQADHNSSHFMFLANVLVGSYVEGDSTMRRPPPKNPSDPTSDLYDSCVDDKTRPRIFVVFDMDQCYPSYVIEYQSFSGFSANHDLPSAVGYPAQGSSVSSSPPNQPRRSLSYYALLDAITSSPQVLSSLWNLLPK